MGLGFAAESSAQGTPATGMASMIVTGANIYTMVWDNPKVTAIAVRGNRLLAVGNDEDIIRLANASTRRIDGRGMTVTPGFIDSHSHPLFAEEAVGVNVNLRRIDEVKEALAGKAAQTPTTRSSKTSGHLIATTSMTWFAIIRCMSVIEAAIPASSIPRRSRSLEFRWIHPIPLAAGSSAKTAN